MIRGLRPGEAVPPGVPSRLPNASGYIRLRWKVAQGEYVEAYEHRVFDGYVTTAAQVHHKNHDRADNRPENLELLTAEEHRAHHGREWRRFDRDEAAILYAEGWTPADIGEHYGVAGATVYRGLRRAGVRMRTSAETTTRFALDCEVLDLHFSEGLRAAAIAERLGVSDGPIRRILKAHGITFRPGRPERAS